MSIKRFFAKTSSEALRKVRDALGPEGVILSNRSMEGGIEILALRQDEISALVPAPAHERSEAGRFEGGDMFLPHVLSSEQAANERKTNRGERGHELRAFSPASPKDLVNRIKKTDVHLFGSPDQRAERKREAKYEAGMDSERDAGSAGVGGASPTEQKRFNQIINAAQIKTRESVTGKSHSTRNLPQPSGDKAALMANYTANPIPDHIAGQLERNKETEVAIPVRRLDDTSGIGTGKSSDSTATSKRKPKQAPVIDTRQLAAEVTSSVLKEIKSMRSALEQQFSSLNWNGHERGDSTRGGLVRKLTAAGFSVPLINGLMEQVPDPESADGGEGAMTYIKAALIRNLETVSDEDEILEKGGIYALVGPTGVGKTTTTAKLAARCVVRHGADKLALLTTDGYRIGGHEQLRIYGKILGVTVYAARDAQDLALALTELRGKHMVLIDTMGVGQRDQMVAEQVAMFAGCGTEIKRLLLLNASSNLHTLNEVAEAYGGDGLSGAIITKLDEAVVIGCALDTAIRHHLPLYYVAQGQRVPEDLELADPRRLVNLALDNLPASPHFGLAETFPLAMTHSKAGNTPMNVDGVRFD
jgi:flagellar biosynthesis protein FlhF